jgi:AcrR family transcriptional regulator
MATRGTYAKGIAKREQILRRAVAVIGDAGPRSTYVKDIADAVGLTTAGLLHYFDSKEEMFTEILRMRDQQDEQKYWPRAGAADDLARLRQGYLDIISHNTEVPGLVQLFMRMAADSPDTDHPAHALFRDRGEKLRGYFRVGIERVQRNGQLNPSMDPATLARVLQAVSDGLQLQWMLEPDFDMAAGVDVLFALLVGPASDPEGEHA